MPKQCSVDECNTKAWTRGYCIKHYARFMKYGNTHTVYQPPSRVKKVCPVCDAKFEVVHSERNRRQCCSISCANKIRNRHPKTSVVLSCTLCGKEFDRKKSQADRTKNGNFCSKKCYDQHQITQVKVICDNCGIEFERMLCHATKKKAHQFCSMKCLGKYNTGENNPFWQGGKSFENYPREFNKELKTKIKERDKCRCQECFRHETEIEHGLVIHHIDYDKTNNDQMNLITLCRVCHGQTVYKNADWIEYYQNRVRGVA